MILCIFYFSAYVEVARYKLKVSRSQLKSPILNIKYFGPHLYEYDLSQ
jgi:hypothetical protein